MAIVVVVESTKPLQVSQVVDSKKRLRLPVCNRNGKVEAESDVEVEVGDKHPILFYSNDVADVAWQSLIT